MNVFQMPFGPRVVHIIRCHCSAEVVHFQHHKVGGIPAVGYPVLGCIDPSRSVGIGGRERVEEFKTVKNW